MIPLAALVILATVTPSAQSVEAWDFVDETFQLDAAPAGNPFVDARLSGEFGRAGGPRLSVDGFCDSEDGRVFRLRFMPPDPGDYTWQATLHTRDGDQPFSGAFHAADGHRRGLLQADPDFPWHFQWAGTGEHYYFAGTTAFFLAGWDDDAVIDAIIDRLARLKVNRVRCMLAARSDHTWTEPIKPGHGFHLCLNPWAARRPDDVRNPGFDYTRFNLDYWRKYERLLRHARDMDVTVSVVFDWNDSPLHPAAGGDDEQRFFRYAAARLGAFSNVTWDLGDDLDSFRSVAWTHDMGTPLHGWDAYHHLATSHPVNNDHQDRAADWFGFTSFQEWHRPLHAWLIEQRGRQAATGRIIPQTDEEYGYEDHYPTWAPYKPPAADAEGNRRTAWDIAMAGCYQTTGETAKRGTGVPPDTGGGWVNGRGDDTMVMLRGYAHLVEFFTAFPWWRADPHDELVDAGCFCLAEPGRLYAVYLPHGGRVGVTLATGRYEAAWFNPRTGERLPLPRVEGEQWTSPTAPDGQDWALLLQRG
jgi:hypothetical protein